MAGEPNRPGRAAAPRRPGGRRPRLSVAAATVAALLLALGAGFGCRDAAERAAPAPGSPARGRASLQAGSGAGPTLEAAPTTAGPVAERPVGQGPADERAIEDDEEAAREHPDIGAPTPPDAVPPEWPAPLPLPPGLVIDHTSSPEGPYAVVEAHHPADAADLLDWFVSNASDAGWLVIRRDQLGAAARVRLARDELRWLVVVAPQTDPSGAPSADACTVNLPATPASAPPRCELRLGRPLAQVPSGGRFPDADGNGDRTALVFLSGNELMLMTLDEAGRRRGPVVVAELDPERLDASTPQVVPGVQGGWLVSYDAGEPLERRTVPFDGALARTDRPLRLSHDLAGPGSSAWVPIARNHNTEYAAAWLEQHETGRVFRVAGVKRDGDRIRRSGRFPARGAEPDVGPELVYAGIGNLGMLWGSADGLFFRAVATDGLPDGAEQRLEPGRPERLGAVFADDSYWVWWDTGTAGFWMRTDLSGCADDARGPLGGRPVQAWATPQGAWVQTRDGATTRLVRLVDRGDHRAVTQPEILGTSDLPLDWSDLSPTDDGRLFGVARTDAGFQTAEWVCGE